MISPPARKSALRFGRHGWLAGVTRIVSPNSDARPEGTVVDLIVIHNISLPPGEFGGSGIVELFTNTLDPGAHPYYAMIASRRVSSHFLIRRDGEIVQFVACDDRAWHAGASEWQGRQRCNDFSIGVELEGADHLPYEGGQYAALTRLTGAIRKRYRIRGIMGHSDVAPGRKTDPGPLFDWIRFLRLIGESL